MLKIKDNKIIKDLKERNDKLVNQYRDRDIRCVSLERQLEKLQQENLKLRIQVSAREEVANKYKAVIDKVIEEIAIIIRDCEESNEEDDLEPSLNDLNYILDILKEVK